MEKGLHRRSALNRISENAGNVGTNIGGQESGQTGATQSSSEVCAERCQETFRLSPDSPP